ncbi:MAG TPA: asparaginase, partial [bacterium (Candidatus Stahlbacteria)]|nr:asparaginase [Candidatus Stahlbacteria bacterium]
MRRHPAIVVQGGAGKKRSGIISARKGVIEAAEKGFSDLMNGASALDVVEKTVVILEDNPIFNAGTGSSLNLNGEVEMDASIMDDRMRFGAVAGIKAVKNPVVVARKVMEETDHIILCGDEAIRFARGFGFKRYNPITQKRRDQWHRLRHKLLAGKKHSYFPRLADLLRKFGTVGAVAYDNMGHLASATSSGGIYLRLPGRVGDSALVGGGTYCDRTGAVSATGHGEKIARMLLARVAVELLAKYGVRRAADLAIRKATRFNCLCGLIIINKTGKF